MNNRLRLVRFLVSLKFHCLRLLTAVALRLKPREKYLNIYLRREKFLSFYSSIYLFIHGNKVYVLQIHLFLRDKFYTPQINFQVSFSQCSRRTRIFNLINARTAFFIWDAGNDSRDRARRIISAQKDRERRGGGKGEKKENGRSTRAPNC